MRVLKYLYSSLKKGNPPSLKLWRARGEKNGKTYKFARRRGRRSIMDAASPADFSGNAKLVGDTRRLIDDDFVAEKWLKKTVSKIAKKYRKAKIKVNYMRGCPLLKSDEKLLAGVKKIISTKNEIRTFAAEDFSKYPVPKVFLLVGTGKNTELHSEEFEAPDELVKKMFDNWLALGKNMDKIIK